MTQDSSSADLEQPQLSLSDGPRRVTSYDVARRAGVSQSAVSRCFTQGASIAPETRQRVMEAAQALGYKPNRLAQGLSTSRSSLVAVLISEVVNLYFPEMLADLTRALEMRGLRLLLFVREDPRDGLALVEEALSHAVDGVISALALTPEMLEPAKAAGVPVVMLNRDGRAADVSSVISDHAGGAALIADKLVDAGCQRIAMVAGPADSPTGRWRGQAFLAQLSAHGLAPVATVEGNYTYESGRDAGRELLNPPNQVDGVFCANDAMAMGFLDVARFERGLTVPDDICIIGFDDLMASCWPSYALTTVRQRADLLTERVASLIAERINAPKRPAAHESIACEMISRSTCR